MQVHKACYKHKKIASFICDIYGDNLSHMAILEAGGAWGVVSDMLPVAKRKIVVEIDPKRVVNSPKHKNIICNIKKMPFVDKEFDICIFSEVLEHINNPSVAVHEICRVSKEVILTTPNNCLTRRILRRMILRKEPDFIAQRQTNGMLEGSGHVKEYNWKEVKDLFDKEKFVLVDFKAIKFIVPQIPWEYFPKLSAKMLMRFKEGKNENTICI